MYVRFNVLLCVCLFLLPLLPCFCSSLATAGSEAQPPHVQFCIVHCVDKLGWRNNKEGTA
jgi:hypothetical protein